jgi:single-stranded-DNA-specific exonuclease
MAAGLSLNKNALAEFSQAFSRFAQNCLGEEELAAKILTDGELASDLFSLETAQALADAGPWGQGFPEPLFDGLFILNESRVLADKHLKMKVTPFESEEGLDAIAFNVDQGFRPPENSRLRLVYRLDVNVYRNSKKLQLVIEHLEMA